MGLFIAIIRLVTIDDDKIHQKNHDHTVLGLIFLLSLCYDTLIPCNFLSELPEVEAARKLVHNYCLGKAVVKAFVAEDDKVVEGVIPKDLKSALEGLTVTSACRHGKQMWIEFGLMNPALLLHLGMNGGVSIKKPNGQVATLEYARLGPSEKGEWPPKYCKLDLEFKDGTHMAFTDSRRFARVKWLMDPRANEPINRLARDAYLDLPTVGEFVSILGERYRKRKSLKIKTLLLDQESLISGIGNWVADEVLYQARIHPEEAVSSLTSDQAVVLHEKIRFVIDVAVNVDSDAERFPPDWLFHVRWSGKKPVSLGGNPVHFVTVGSRTSAFVPKLQKLQGLSSGPDAIVVLDDDKFMQQKQKVRKTKAGATAEAKKQDIVPRRSDDIPEVAVIDDEVPNQQAAKKRRVTAAVKKTIKLAAT
ncbi:hypothetical protein CEUSTIGMA_g2986.t1 [Chlamydomonas eustigma]|uniref:Formamidopyrimidine-DNA glycosylase catalytic domain-containing protein n=1 Tax=Chlamydomonas eustigma TaxID=1157962 RepID=A0A250WXH7_9CHLO|nr:hypothetical protein CEUSTIGMA_g2986.t1 [Chlamydomonas eustigma]|eukprot:GAX75543.1 hypothetical protein CEUSTIGMA_g2986.t1 [Chlamydomonas eustigma]